MNMSSPGAYNKANIFLGLTECDLNSLLGASHFIDYKLRSVHIRFHLEKYLLTVFTSNSSLLYNDDMKDLFIVRYRPSWSS